MRIIKRLKEFLKYDTGKYKIWSTQNYIDNSKLNDIENLISKNKFDFNNKIAGYLFNGEYYISEGHHRIVAALNYWKNTGDYTAVETMIENGIWYDCKKEPYPKWKLPYSNK